MAGKLPRFRAGRLAFRQGQEARSVGVDQRHPEGFDRICRGCQCQQTHPLDAPAEVQRRKTEVSSLFRFVAHLAAPFYTNGIESEAPVFAEVCNNSTLLMDVDDSMTACTVGRINKDR